MSLRHKLTGRNLVFLLLFTGFSLLTGFETLRKLRLGTAAEMGPGYFPLVLSITLGMLTILAVVTAPIPDPDTPRQRLTPLRGVVMILGAPLVFSLCIENLGLVPAAFISVLFATQASVRAKPLESLLLSAGFTVFCVITFVWLLNLPLALWGPMLPF